VETDLISGNPLNQDVDLLVHEGHEFRFQLYLYELRAIFDLILSLGYLKNAFGVVEPVGVHRGATNDLDLLDDLDKNEDEVAELRLTCLREMSEVEEVL